MMARKDVEEKKFLGGRILVEALDLVELHQAKSNQILALLGNSHRHQTWLDHSSMEQVERHQEALSGNSLDLGLEVAGDSGPAEEGLRVLWMDVEIRRRSIVALNAFVVYHVHPEPPPLTVDELHRRSHSTSELPGH